jgi:hypothetical protein
MIGSPVMKLSFRLFFLLIAGVFFLAIDTVRAQDDSGDDQGASFQTFYDQLGDQGSWVQTDDYGYVFQPNVSDPNWAPYTDGNWAYTDEGWTWVSNEPWGWATYHYGRWANIDGMGWVWVPGHRWGPAWVSWRYGGGYVGWAPLPPGANYDDQDSDYHFGGDVDVSFDIGPGWYNFVPEDQIGAPDCGRVIINRYRNYSIINRTTNITNINVSRNGGAGRNGFGGIAANGPPIQEINAHATHRVPTVQLTAAAGPGKSSVQGNTLAVFAPKVNPATAHQAKPSSVSRSISHATFNQGTSITKPLEVTSTVHAAPPTAAQIKKAQTAQNSIPSAAKIATSHTAAKTVSSPSPSTSTAVRSESENTGEPQHTQAQPPTSFHPQTENTEPQHTETQPTFHPQTENTAPQHTETQPPTSFRPQTENTEPQHTEAQPPASFHPQTENTAPQRTETQPPTSFHPENEGGNQHTESRPAEPSHSESPGGGGGQPHVENKPASAPHPSAPPQGPKPSSGGGGKPPDKKPGQ